MTSTDMMASVRDRLRELGMSPSDLAHASGVGRSLVGKYLKGEVSPSVVNYEKMLQGLDLGVSVAPVRARVAQAPVAPCSVQHLANSQSLRDCPVHGVKKARAATASRRAANAPAPSLASPCVPKDLVVTYSSGGIDLLAIKRSTPDRARMRLRASLAESVWDAAALEGNTYTLPEVRTLIDGVTVGGKSLHETEQILGLRDAFRRLDELLASESFSLTKEVSDELHVLVARHEALDAGMFRGQGDSTGGGHVRLSSGARVEGMPHGEGGSLLVDRYAQMLNALDAIGDARMQALAYFAAATRTQYYFDGNKRTARLMMTGHLVANGYDPVSVPNSRRLEFNNALDVMFESGDATDLMAFLVSCAD